MPDSREAALMEAAFKDAEISQEVEEFKKGEFHKESVEIEMEEHGVVEKGSSITSSARAKPVWNRETGVMSMVLTDQAHQRLSQIFPLDHPNPEFRGKRVYTTLPMEPVNPGKMKCKLHSEHPDRAFLDRWFKGQHCPKSNMRTPLDVDMHFEHKHKGEHKVVQDYEERQHKEAILEMQRLQMESMQAIAGKDEVSPDAPQEALEECPYETCAYRGTRAQINGHKSVHNKTEAPSS